MTEAELVSELVIAIIDGIQSKAVMEKYYEKYDDSLPGVNKIITDFKHTMDTIGNIFDDTLPNSRFHHREEFYSIFCVIFDLLYGLKDSPLKHRVNLKPNAYPKVRTAIGELDTIFNNPTDYPKYEKFISAFHTHTTSVTERKLRHEVILKIILKVLA
jgi:hypothetical protein